MRFAPITVTCGWGRGEWSKEMVQSRKLAGATPKVLASPTCSRRYVPTGSLNILDYAR